MTKKKVIDAIKWHFGMTKSEAEEFMKTITYEGQIILVDGYERNSRLIFKDD